MAIATLKRRSEFLRLRGGRRWSSPAFVIEMKAREATSTGVASAAVTGTLTSATGAGAGARFGFTATKKLGNAVIRNRIRRRLKEALRIVAPGRARDGCDYVLIAREAAASQPFAALERDLITALGRLDRPSEDDRRPARHRNSTSGRT
ncbi:MAG: ribonuclease P protein component [Hyphomicrobiaceae bacterium]